MVIRTGFIFLLTIKICFVSLIANAQNSADPSPDETKILGAEVSRSALGYKGRQSFDALLREPCDTVAVRSLGHAVAKAGYRRQAARLLVSFSTRCGEHAPSLRSAINYLLKISDWLEAVSISTKLIELEPFEDNGYYLRGRAYFKSHQPEQAIDDLITAIELFEDKSRISSSSYLMLSKSYEQIGQYCEAITPIETWININPDRYDTDRTQAIISSLRAKGECSSQAKKRERFRISRRGAVIKITARINGKKGRFLLDTGATYVSLKRSFAKKAKIKINNASSIRLNTANGIVSAKRGRARLIQLRSLSAKNVPVVVQNDKKGTYGRGVDGLLGMSFLSRFNVSMGRKYLTINSRK